MVVRRKHAKGAGEYSTPPPLLSKNQPAGSVPRIYSGIYSGTYLRTYSVT